MFCIKCGKELPADAGFCPACGAPVMKEGAGSESVFGDGKEKAETVEAVVSDAADSDGSCEKTTVIADVSPKSRLCALLLGIFLGSFGIHNFYLGRIGRGIAQCLMCVMGWVLYFGALFGLIGADKVDNDRLALFFGIAVFGTLLLFMAAWVWALVEWILIAAGKAKDSKKLPVKNW